MEQFPKPGHIRKYAEIYLFNSEEYLGVPQLEYPPIPQEERDDAIRDMGETVERLRRNLGVSITVPPKKKLTIRPSTLSIDEQKAELKRRGLL